MSDLLRRCQQHGWGFFLRTEGTERIAILFREKRVIHASSNVSAAAALREAMMQARIL